MEMKFSLGDRVKDKITGYKGTITSVCFSINKPVAYMVEGIDTTGRPIGDWIDEHRLKLDKIEKPINNNKHNEIPKEKQDNFSLKHPNAAKKVEESLADIFIKSLKNNVTDKKREEYLADMFITFLKNDGIEKDKKDDHDCKNCEMAPLCATLDILTENKK